MRVKKTKFENEDMIIIYVSNKEADNEETKKKIQEYRNSYKSVGVFYSGKEPIRETLYQMILNERNNLE